MLPPTIEQWRSRMQGGDPLHPTETLDPFFRDVLTELNDLSNVLERIAGANEIEVVQAGLNGYSTGRSRRVSLSIMMSVGSKKRSSCHWPDQVRPTLARGNPRRRNPHHPPCAQRYDRPAQAW
jgi:hypothetical protein